MIRDGVATGFAVELLQAAASVMGMTVEFDHRYWDEILQGMRAGEFDVIPIVARDPSRAEFMDFSFPYIVIRGNIFVRTGDDRIRTQADLMGKELLVQNADIVHDFAVARNLSDRITLFRTYTEAFHMLSQGTGDAVLAANLVGNQVLAQEKIRNVQAVTRLKDDGVSLRRLELDDFEQKFCFGIRHGDNQLLADLNEGLAIVYGDGTFQALYRKWFPFLVDDRPSPALIASWLAGILGPLLVLGILLHNVFLRRQVNAKTREIRKSYQLLESIMDNTPSPIYLFDTGGRLVTCNARFSALMGRSKEELKGQTRQEFMPADIAENHRANDLDVMKLGQGIQFEETNREDGGIRYYQSLKFPLYDELGTVYAICGISTDITERIEFDRQLMQKNRDFEQAKLDAEQAASVKSRFLSNMSHEIRNPLNGIIGLTRLLSRTSLDPEQTEYVQLIQSSNDLLLGIVNDILDLAKIESGRRETKPEALDIREELRELVDSFRYQASEKGLGLEWRVDESIPAAILIDPRSLRQILINLVNNAVKFTDQGGVHIELVPGSPGWMHLTVKDTGIGIPRDKLELVFEKFSQLDSSYTKRFQGTGLGLSIVRELVGLMGIRLEVESDPGKGSCFSLDIPLVPAGDTLPEPVVPASTVPEQRIIHSVLVVEDNAINALMLKRLLEKQGYRADTASDGKQGLEKALTGQYDLVLMDVQMPIMNGLDCTRELRRQGIRIPVLALTGYALKENLDEFLAAGMNDCLAKPLEERRLLALIDRYGKPV
jgi:PAS domain S-box-containing protein